MLRRLAAARQGVARLAGSHAGRKTGGEHGNEASEQLWDKQMAGAARLLRTRLPDMQVLVAARQRAASTHGLLGGERFLLPRLVDALKLYARLLPEALAQSRVDLARSLREPRVATSPQALLQTLSLLRAVPSQPKSWLAGGASGAEGSNFATLLDICLVDQSDLSALRQARRARAKSMDPALRAIGAEARRLSVAVLQDASLVSPPPASLRGGNTGEAAVWIGALRGCSVRARALGKLAATACVPGTLPGLLARAARADAAALSGEGTARLAALARAPVHLWEPRVGALAGPGLGQNVSPLLLAGLDLLSDQGVDGQDAGSGARNRDASAAAALVRDVVLGLLADSQRPLVVAVAIIGVLSKDGARSEMISAEARALEDEVVVWLSGRTDPQMGLTDTAILGDALASGSTTRAVRACLWALTRRRVASGALDPDEGVTFLQRGTRTDHGVWETLEALFAGLMARAVHESETNVMGDGRDGQDGGSEAELVSLWDEVLSSGGGAPPSPSDSLASSPLSSAETIVWYLCGGELAEVDRVCTTASTAPGTWCSAVSGIHGASHLVRLVLGARAPRNARARLAMSARRALEALAENARESQEALEPTARTVSAELSGPFSGDHQPSQQRATALFAALWMLRESLGSEAARAAMPWLLQHRPLLDGGTENQRVRDLAGHVILAQALMLSLASKGLPPPRVQALRPMIAALSPPGVDEHRGSFARIAALLRGWCEPSGRRPSPPLFGTGTTAAYLQPTNCADWPGEDDAGLVLALQGRATCRSVAMLLLASDDAAEDHEVAREMARENDWFRNEVLQCAKTQCVEETGVLGDGLLWGVLGTLEGAKTTGDAQSEAVAEELGTLLGRSVAKFVISAGGKGQRPGTLGAGRNSGSGRKDTTCEESEGEVAERVLHRVLALQGGGDAARRTVLSWFGELNEDEAAEVQAEVPARVMRSMLMQRRDCAGNLETTAGLPAGLSAECGVRTMVCVMRALTQSYQLATAATPVDLERALRELAAALQGPIQADTVFARTITRKPTSSSQCPALSASFVLTDYSND